MATNLRNMRDAKGDRISAVAGADDIAELFSLDACGLQRVEEAPFRGPRDIGAGVGERSGKNLELVVDDNPFGLGGADVDACRVNHTAPPASLAWTSFLCSNDSKKASMRFLI